MVKMIDEYLEASEAPRGTRAAFTLLERAIPKLPKQPLAAATKVKKWLHSHGFSYDFDAFKAQDVLKKRAGNCLGTPLLIGAILDQRGIPFEYEVLVNPQDAVWGREQSFVKRYNEETPYNLNNLAAEPVDFPVLRCVPLEHMVLHVGDNRFEVTSPESDYAMGESQRPLNPSQAMSYVFKDRAVEEGLAGNTDRAKELAAKGLSIWPANRELHILDATLENGNGNSKAIGEVAEKYAKIGGCDSLFNFNRFLTTGNEQFLNEALAQNPAYAQAVAVKAALVTPIEQREARFLYGLASQLYANSSVLSLSDFYTAHTPQLVQLFGREKINDRLRGFLHPTVEAGGWLA